MTETHTAEQIMMRRLKRIAMPDGVRTPGQLCVSRRPTGGGYVLPVSEGGAGVLKLILEICRVGWFPTLIGLTTCERPGRIAPGLFKL